MSSVVVIGGTAGIGHEIARTRAERGDEVVLTGRDAHRADTAAKGIGARGLALDLSRPREIAPALAGVEHVDHLVLAGISRDRNTVTEYDIEAALQLVTLKLVGYTEVVHTLVPRMHTAAESAVVIFGGQAKERPYPGATTVATVNAGVTGLVRTLATELAPIRVNAIHPGIVGDSPFWADKPAEVLENYRAQTPTGQLARMRDVVDAVDFLLCNVAVNGVDLAVDGGWLLR
ncbi:SDR family oxidoreductase [Streptomyces sp. NPDC048484]|uniref:SDR family NAD(P)-dependent oxidoreductase n=1 Tax=Streptomyces sp. NPDC048484 TaxID=3155146 RepID=UPI00342822F4